MKVKIIPLATLMVLCIVGMTSVCFAGVEVMNVDVPEKVYTQTYGQQPYGPYTCEVNVNVVLKNIGEKVILNIPILVNGVQKANIIVELNKDEVKWVNRILILDSGREKIVNPFSPPLTYIDYDISVGDIHDTVSVYAFPDWIYWAIALDVVCVMIMFWMYRWVSKP